MEENRKVISLDILNEIVNLEIRPSYVLSSIIQLPFLFPFESEILSRSFGNKAYVYRFREINTSKYRKVSEVEVFYTENNNNYLDFFSGEIYDAFGVFISSVLEMLNSLLIVFIKNNFIVEGTFLNSKNCSISDVSIINTEDKNNQIFEGIYPNFKDKRLEDVRLNELEKSKIIKDFKEVDIKGYFPEDMCINSDDSFYEIGQVAINKSRIMFLFNNGFFSEAIHLCQAQVEKISKLIAIFLLTDESMNLGLRADKMKMRESIPILAHYILQNSMSEGKSLNHAYWEWKNKVGVLRNMSLHDCRPISEEEALLSISNTFDFLKVLRDSLLAIETNKTLHSSGCLMAVELSLLEDYNFNYHKKIPNNKECENESNIEEQRDEYTLMNAEARKDMCLLFEDIGSDECFIEKTSNPKSSKSSTWELNQMFFG